MSSPERSVMITGVGAVTPLGGTAGETWESMLAGRSGVRTLTEPWAEALPVRIAAQVTVDPVAQLGRVKARRLGRAGQFATVAAREAWADAGIPEVDPWRLGVVVSAGLGGVHPLLDSYDALLRGGPRKVSPLTVPMLMPNSAAAALGIEFQARAGVHAPSSACASGSEAVAQGFEMIRSGRADVVIAGGADASLHPLSVAAFGNMRALSRRNDEPERASRPYDRDRDGCVMGEGAGIVVLESAEHVAARGARSYAELCGVGMSSDGSDMVEPVPEGLAFAITQALRGGDVSKNDVVHLNAHATSTPKGDLSELAAVRFAHGGAGLAISATKSMTGHLLGAAGAVEALATVLALHHRVAPPTINVDHLDPAVDLDIVLDKPRDLPLGPIAALSNSAGFGGHNVALVFRTP